MKLKKPIRGFIPQYTAAYRCPMRVRKRRRSAT
jgi:hypothetical protein